MSGFDLGSLDWMDSVQPTSMPMPSGVGDLFTDFSSGPKGGLSGLWDNLTNQFSNIGKNAVANPLGALAAGLGAYGAYKEGKPVDTSGYVNAVDKLMMKGDMQNKWTPEPVKYNKPVALDPRRYVQTYDMDGNATFNNINAGTVSDLYKQTLGRTPDSGGAKFWENNMNTLGMTPEQLEMELWGSPEARVRRTYQGTVGRAPEFHAMNYWNDRLKGNPNDQETLRSSLLAGPENAVNSLYREELGRAPDREGRDYWMNRMNNGLDANGVRSSLRASPEFAALKKPAPVATPTAVAPPVRSVGGLGKYYGEEF